MCIRGSQKRIEGIRYFVDSLNRQFLKEDLKREWKGSPAITIFSNYLSVKISKEN